MDSVYNRALLEVGPGGYFQKEYDFIINIAFSAIWSMIYMQIIVVLVVVPHTCRLPEKTVNMTDEAWKLKYIPHEIVHNNIKFDSCLIYQNPDENNATNKCSEYEYDKTWYDSTVSTDNNWVCDKEIYIPNILAYSKVMELIGSLFFGWMSDSHGRRLTYITTLLLIILGRIISLLAGTSYLVFVLGCSLSSFAIWTSIQSVSLISVEITSPERRSMITSMRCTAGCIGVVTMAITYWWLKDWKIFIVVTSAPFIIFILFSWHMIESPQWQHTNGKTKQCIKQLKRIAKANGRTLEPETEKELLSDIPQREKKTLGPLALFSRRRLAINTLLHLSLCVVGTIAFSIQVLSIGQEPGENPYLELCVQTLSEIPANFISGWIADRMGRRYTSAVSFLLSCLAWLLMAFRETSLNAWIRLWWIGTILNIIIRITNAITFFVSCLLSLELYPTSLRQSGMAFGNVSASVGSVLAPYILFLTRRIDKRLPGLIVCAMCMCAVFASLMLPETTNTKLPETIEEAESIGRKKAYFSVRSKELNAQEKNTSLSI